MSSPHVQATVTLTHAGALAVLEGAVAKAAEIGVPQCIAVVDPGGNLLAFVRMDGAKVLSEISAMQKACTAASSRVATGGMPDADLALKLAVATDGRVINVPGGLPIWIDGQLAGAIGVGSGTGEQDVTVGRDGLAAIGAKESK
jgi:glc operon protein GlcG